MIEHEYLIYIGYKYDEQTFTMDGSFDLRFKYYGEDQYDFYKYVGVNNSFDGLYTFDGILGLMASLGFAVSMESFKLFKRSETIKKILKESLS